MTSYRIEIGYNSAHSTDAVEQKLRMVTEEICRHPELILKEALLREGKVIPSEYGEAYRQPWQDKTIQFLLATEDRSFCVYQMASGGGIEREYKEAMRRAFCRLVIEMMHRKGMEVTMVVG